MIARFHCIIVLQLSTPPMAPSPAKNFARMSRGCGFQTRLGHIQAGVRWLITPPKSALATRRRKLPEMSPKLWDKERSMDAAARHLGITFSKPALSPTPAADRKTELDTEIARLRARIAEQRAVTSRHLGWQADRTLTEVLFLGTCLLRRVQPAAESARLIGLTCLRWWLR